MSEKRERFTPKEAAALNPYHPALYRAMRRFVFLNGVINQTDLHFRSVKGQAEKVGARGKAWHGGYGLGAALTVDDPTISPVDRWARPLPMGAYMRFGSAYLRAVERLAERERGFAVGEAFEIFEAFIFDIAAILLRRNRHFINDEVWKNERKPCPTPAKRSLAAHRKFVKNRYRIETILKCFRMSIPSIDAGERRNARFLDFPSSIKVIEQVRHSCFHARGVVSKTQLRGKLNNGLDRLLRKGFHGRATRGGAYELRIQQKQAEQAIQLLAEYAILLFKQISVAEGLDGELFAAVHILA